MINKMYQQYFMTGIFYEMINGTQTPCEVKDIFLSALAATNDQSLVAAVTGKRIVVLSGTISPSAAAGLISFKSAALVKHRYYLGANPDRVLIPPQPWGAFSTLTGEALLVDNTSANVVAISIRYIEVTP